MWLYKQMEARQLPKHRGPIMCNYLDLVWIIGAIAVMGATTITALVAGVYYTLEAVALYRSFKQ